MVFMCYCIIQSDYKHFSLFLHSVKMLLINRQVCGNVLYLNFHFTRKDISNDNREAAFPAHQSRNNDVSKPLCKTKSFYSQEDYSRVEFVKQLPIIPEMEVQANSPQGQTVQSSEKGPITVILFRFEQFLRHQRPTFVSSCSD